VYKLNRSNRNAAFIRRFFARALGAAVVPALLAATAAAFIITESAKLEESPITATFFGPRYFSPASVAVENHPAIRFVVLRFRLREPERITVWIDDARGGHVRTLLPIRSEPRGARITLIWDGRIDSGGFAGDGEYHPVVRLWRTHRTFQLPNAVDVDMGRPTIHGTLRSQLALVAGVRGYDRVRVSYSVSEPAHIVLFVGGEQVFYTRSRSAGGIVSWNGRIGAGPEALGPHEITIAARDDAGNVSAQFAVARLRFTRLIITPKIVRARPRAMIRIRVVTAAHRVRWKLGTATGIGTPPTLLIRMPARRGAYELQVAALTFTARAAVRVR
jgi:hypothetical protein